MTPTLRAALAAILVVLATGCTAPPQVVQGTVTSINPESHVLVMTDEKSPGRQLSLSLEGAEIGAQPAPGDTVRVAFRAEGDKLVATRVMNLTRQGDIKGGGH
jgi:ribosomal protein S1